MHLVLGHPADPCCAGVEAAFRARGQPVRFMTMALPPRARLILRIDPGGIPVRPGAALSFDGEAPDEIQSVFVRGGGAVDPAGWESGDHAYMQAETQAVVLAWLAALSCPVVNRAVAELWYRPRNPLLHWAPLLRRCGLPTPEIVVTNDVEAARAFRHALEADGVPGAICGALARAGEWLVGSDDWAGVAALQRHAPVCLAEPHRGVLSACVVGRSVIWDKRAAPALVKFEPRMLRFAAAAGLDFVEFALARVRRGWAVVHVDQSPRLEHFGRRTRSRIIEALIASLAPDRSHAPELAETAR